MPKGTTKAAQKKVDVKAAPAQKKIEKKTQKVVKKVAAKAAAPKAQKAGRQGGKNYFTIAEDNTILEHIKRGTEGKTKTEVAKELAARLNRGVEAVRDRIKRYLAKLSQTDQAQLAKEAKRDPKTYVYFKKAADGSRKIEKIDKQPPSLQNRDIKRRPRVSKNKKPDAKKVTKAPENKIAWIAQKLQDKDQYFKLDFSVQVLTDIINVAMEEEKVALKDVDNLINNTFSNLTLEQILNALKVAKDAK